MTTMDFRRIGWISVALAVGLALSGSLTASAQGQRGGNAEPYTSANDAKDLKAVLFNWERNMGMLKGHDEREMVAMLVRGEELTSKSCQRKFKVSGPAVYADFETLLRLGLARRIGAGRSTRYVLQARSNR